MTGDVPLGRGRGIISVEGRARVDVEGDESLLAGFQANALGRQVTQADAPTAFSQQWRQRN